MRRGVEGCLVSGGFVSAIVRLPRGLFFNAAVTAYVLILGGDGGSGSVLFVSTSRLFVRRKGGGGLSRSSVGGICRTCMGHSSVFGFYELIPTRRIRRVRCSVSITACIRGGRSSRVVSVSGLGGRVGRVITHRRMLEGSVSRVVSALG